MTASRPVLMIGWDAADKDLVDRLCSEGHLPGLQTLRRKGATGSLGNDRLLFAGGVWPTFYTGKGVPSHGIYQNRLWRPDKMRHETASPKRHPEMPFWEKLDPRLRIAIVDVPMTIAAPRPLNGILLEGWGTHDLVARGSYPAGLWAKLRRELGGPLVEDELFGPQTVQSLVRLRASLLAATEQMTRICELLLAEPWDLFLVVLGAPHRAGHYLWDRSQVDTRHANPGDREVLQSALPDIYKACDQALTRLIENAPPRARTLVFALHGMGRNAGWTDRFPDLLAALDHPGRETTVAGPGVKARAKQFLPAVMRRSIAAALSPRVRNLLVEPLSARLRDWSRTRYFPLDMDHAGYLRVNLSGREKYGVVREGAEYESVCDDLIEALSGFSDLASGEPIVASVLRREEIASRDAPFWDELPDLVVQWGRVSAIGSPGIRSTRNGEIRWRDFDKLPSGRAGNHRGRGWFVAAGEGITAGRDAGNHDREDLVPTLLRWLGADPRDDLQGRPIAPLVGAVDESGDDD